MLVAVIAAAGRSSRMGMPKALLPWGSKYIVHALADQFLALPRMRVMTTLPPNIIAHVNIDDARMTKLGNHYPEDGYLGSIKTAIDHCQHDVAGMFITPVDVPVPSRALLMIMVSLAQRSSPVIMVPHFFASAGHPVYVSRHFFVELRQFLGIGLRAFITEHQRHLQKILWPEQTILANLNTRHDVSALMSNKTFL